MQGYNLEICHIPSKRSPVDTLSKQDKKDALGRKTAVHDANIDLVKELRVPSDADDTAIQEALMRLFNAQIRDQSETVVEEGQAIRAQRSISESDQALKASVSDSVQSCSVQSVSESKPSRSVQFSSDVPISSNSSQSNSQCTLAVGRHSIQIENSLKEKINSLLKQEILYKEILKEMESTGKNELIQTSKKTFDDSCHWAARGCAVLASGYPR